MPPGDESRRLDYQTLREGAPREAGIPSIVISLGKLIGLIGAVWLLAYLLSVVNLPRPSPA